MASHSSKKEQTRHKIIESAGRGFRANGYGGIGVDALAKAAGVTSGAFYAHMGSKHGAFQAALLAGLRDVVDAIPRLQELHGEEWLRVFVDYYLGEAHRGDLECGCAMASLTGEVVRLEHEFHALYEAQMDVIIDLVARGLAGGSAQNRRNRAICILGLLIGGLNMVRAMHTPSAREEAARAVREAVLITASRLA